MISLWSVVASATDQSPEGRIAALENGEQTKIGLAAIDTKTGRRIECRANERFPMCSTFKLLAVGAVLQRVDQTEEHLDRFIRYTDRDLLEYALVTREHVKESGMTLSALCQAAIEQSDNTAGNLLLEAIGGPSSLTNFAVSLGDHVTHLDHREPDLNDIRPPDDRDTTSPAAMCEDIRRLLASAFLSARSRGLLLEWLEGNRTGNELIRAGVPAGWLVGDKTGRSRSGATNDVAVIYSPDNVPIFLAIFSIGTKASDPERFAIVANATRMVIEIFRPR